VEGGCRGIESRNSMRDNELRQSCMEYGIEIS
jgi:hypothetical protein